MRILILEDSQERIDVFTDALCFDSHEIIIVETAEDAITYLEKDEFDLLMLDHDLGGECYVDTAEKNTGSEVVRWLTNSGYRSSPVIIVHSMNEPAARSMEHALAYDGFEVHRIPFVQMIAMDYLNDPFFIQ